MKPYEKHHLFLVGNPNSGKTTIFNHLTGLNQKTGNFSGVTVEKKEGFFKHQNSEIKITDLPGTYGIGGVAEDKKIAYEVLLARKPNERVLYVLDSLNLERGLQFLLQILDMGVPTIIALTMKDVLEKKRIQFNLQKLEQSLGIKIILINAKSGEGLQQLKEVISNPSHFKTSPRLWTWDKNEENFLTKIKKELQIQNNESEFFLTQALKYINNDPHLDGKKYFDAFPKETQEHLLKKTLNQKLNFLYEEEIIRRSFFIKSLVTNVIEVPKVSLGSLEKKLDSIFLHPIFGFFTFFLFMGLLFQSLFQFAELPMNWIEDSVSFVQTFLANKIPVGPFRSLLIEGIIGGVGSIIVFIPQISLLFLFIGILEETGYLARASFLMDKLMGNFGLSGKSFIPLLSSAACAVPAILGTRTIENKSDRLTTILVSPLIMCSARYPVYILIIGTIFNFPPLFGFINVQGFVLFCMFFLGMITSLVFALIFRKTVFRESSSYFIIELPRYMVPSFRSLFQTVLSKIKSFLVSAGQIILYISIVLWFLSHFPSKMNEDSWESSPIESSYIGKLGKAIEPALEPMGFDWKIGISILTSFAAREVMVSTLAVLYGTDDSEESSSLRESLQSEIRSDGTRVWTPLSGLSLLIFFAFASQCMSTLAVSKKESGTLWVPSLQFLYMTGLAILSSTLIFQVGKALGFQ